MPGSKSRARYALSPDCLRYAMGKAGLTVRGLACKSGVSDSSIRNYLTGGSPDPGVSAVAQLAHALGCDVEDLIVDAGSRF